MDDLVLRERVGALESSLARVENVLEALKQARETVGLAAVAESIRQSVEEARQQHFALSALLQNMNAATSPEWRHKMDGALSTLRMTLDQAAQALMPDTARRVDLGLTQTRGLVERVQSRKREVIQLRERLDIQAGGKAANYGPGDDAAAQTAAWADYQALDRACHMLFRDYLDLLRGVALRDSGLDDGLCRIADRLVMDVSVSVLRWDSITVPASIERRDESAAMLIRLGFPEWSVWTLPLAVVEYGHLLVAEAKRAVDLANDVAAWLGVPPRVASALVADGFAASVLGPAYGWSALLGRVAPSDLAGASDVERTAQRKHEVLRRAVVLAVLDENAGSAADIWRRDLLADEWAAVLARALPGLDLVNETSLLAEDVAKVRKGVLDQYPPRIIAAEWDNIARLADELRGDLTVDEVVEKLAAEYFNPSLLHVLNAAWAARLSKREMVTALSKRTHDLCLVVIEPRDGRSLGQNPVPRRNE